MTLTITNNISSEVKNDILELDSKIKQFRKNNIPADKFASYRLLRGVYGQRQKIETDSYGVQMIRIKLPFGRVTSEQLIRIADVADEFTNGNLHTTTRQDIQLHFVRLDDTAELLTKLEEAGITTRDACGNTVRNITASSIAGIDPDEPFDVSPYANELFKYFLRNPICQDLGRKFKIAFSSSDKDSAYTYFHDLGFIPKIKIENGIEARGFKVVIGGGLGAQTYIAQTAFEFLEENKIIPFTESVLRVFDRYGERTKRFKARIKFLIDEENGIGLNHFLELVKEEENSLKSKSYKIDRGNTLAEPPTEHEIPDVTLPEEKKYADWLKTNVFQQKQKGFYAVQIKLQLGNIHSDTARKLALLVKGFASDDIRITVNQGLLLKFIRRDALKYIYSELDKIGLAEPGFDTIADITACPGTDTCNLGVANSTGLAKELEKLIKEEYYDLIFDSKIRIKISGCMNSCGQHMAADIGFHGSSVKNGAWIVPAMQLVLGGGLDPDGVGRIGDKIIKLPSKRVPDALRTILNDYEEKAIDGEYFNQYYRRFGEIYFYQLLKPLSDKSSLKDDDYIDWGQTESFKPEIGVGECAGATYDVVSSILADAEEKLGVAKKLLLENAYADSIYQSYGIFIVTAKALLLSVDVKCNTQINIIRDFDKHFVAKGDVFLGSDFESLVLQINKNKPVESFANQYFNQAKEFINKANEIRKSQIEFNLYPEEKIVVENYYKA